MMTGNLQRQYRPFRRMFFVLSLLFILAPAVNASADIAAMFHNTQQNEQSTPCHEEQTSSTQCCCDADASGHACQCGPGHCISSMSMIMLSDNKTFDMRTDIVPDSLLLTPATLSPPITLRPPITHL